MKKSVGLIFLGIMDILTNIKTIHPIQQVWNISASTQVVGRLINGAILSASVLHVAMQNESKIY